MKILVTGASRGIGYETARILASSNKHQLLVLGRSEIELAKLERAVAEQEGADKLNYLVFDLNASPAEKLEKALNILGGLDILINNAGLLIKKSFEQLSAKDWKQVFDTNFFAAVNIIKVCLPYLEKAQRGHIVNIGSMGGFQGSSKFNGLAAYSASKAALGNLTECLAEEFKEKNIAVNCLSLGAVQTEMLSTAFPDYQAPVSSGTMGGFVAKFAVEGHQFFNGKILPVSLSTP